jgi:hypothetical protein
MVRGRGISMLGFLLFAGFLVVLALLGFRLLPAFIEYFEIRNALSAIARDLEMKDASPQAVRTAFEKRAQIDDIRVIGGRDIEISKENGQLVLSTTYSKRVPLAGNTSLCFDFDITAGK